MRTFLQIISMLSFVAGACLIISISGFWVFIGILCLFWASDISNYLQGG